MKHKKRRNSTKAPLPLEKLEQFATSILKAAGEKQPGERFRLTKASGIWICANGTLTARLVYRADYADNASASLVYQIRNIAIERAEAC